MRIEIEAALAKKVPVIPVLVDGTKIPPARDLPEGVRDLVYPSSRRREFAGATSTLTWIS